MALINDLWLAALTKDEDDAGSNDRFNLTVNIDGEDVFDQDFILGWRPLGSGVVNGLGEGQAGLEESESLQAQFESNSLTNSSIRLGLREDDAWGPEHVLLIGRTEPSFEPGRTVALAMETDLTHWLSSDNSEGHLTRCAFASSGQEVRRL
jgi:hypothetical protein